MVIRYQLISLRSVIHPSIRLCLNRRSIVNDYVSTEISYYQLQMCNKNFS